VTRVRLPFLVALSLSVILLVAWVAAGAWNRHARRLERERAPSSLRACSQ
jgi:hypothetical protein